MRPGEVKRLTAMIARPEEIPDELSSLDCLLRDIARITIELETPMHIGSGKEWDESDAGFVLDANGLPTVPLSGLLGVLRHAYTKTHGAKAANSLFGFQGHKANGEGTGRGSRLRGSFGCIHDSGDMPIYGLSGKTDRVIAAALRPALRDHARLNGSGVAVNKFDELVVCVGHRFTFELELIGNEGDKAHWNALISLLSDPLTRLGGKSRRGLGRFRVVRMLRRRFDFVNGGFEDYASYDSQLHVPVSVSEVQPGKWQSFTPQITIPPTITVTLRPRFFWMFGSGRDIDGDSDIAPVREQRIIWEGNVPKVHKELLYLPGSSLKGALRHRAWFHAQAKFGHFADKPNPRMKAEAQRVVTALFGNEWDAERETRRLQPGILRIDDQFQQIEATLAPLQHHVSIDRFTGGARESLLFDERPAWRSGTDDRVTCENQPGFSFSIQLLRELEADEEEVLRRCLNDLTQGRLSIGGGSGRGHGFCDGSYISKFGSSESDGLSLVSKDNSTIATP